MIPTSRNHPIHSWPQPGTVVSIPTFLVYRHKGIISDRWYNGKPMIISNSARAGGTYEEPWDVFAEGHIVTVESYPSDLPNHEVVNRARSFVGTQYDLFSWNCEHLVTVSHGLKSQSPQVAITIAVAAMCIGVLSLAK